jgi:hypothetical protein
MNNEEIKALHNLEVQVAKLSEKVDSNIGLTKTMHTVLIGDTKINGIATRVSLLEQTVKRLWYFWGLVIMLIGGLIVKVIFA